MWKVYKKNGSSLSLVSKLYLTINPFICNSPYSQRYNYHNVSSENSVLDQLFIPKLVFFFILITYLVDIVLVF